MTEEKEPVYVHCSKCQHEWVAFYTPLLMDKYGLKLLKHAGKMPCPMCCSPKTLMGRSERTLHAAPNADIQSRANEWIANGATGLSSKAIWSMMMTGECKGNYPLDPDDFCRCQKLLDFIPEWHDRLNLMRGVSKIWDALIENWQRIESQFDEEVGRHWEHKEKSAEKTYDLMRSILDNLEKAA